MNHVGGIGPDKVVKALEQLFEKCSLWVCKNCDSVYNLAEKNCYVRRHKGEQIPVEGDQMEVVEEDEETGEPYIVVKYTCCGEVAKDDEGCEQVDMGPHVPSSQFSSLSFENQPIYVA